MNRRNFFNTLASAVAGFTVLPPATTYSRIWRATMKLEPWGTQQLVYQSFIPKDYYGTWHWIQLYEDPKYPMDGDFVTWRAKVISRKLDCAANATP